MQRLKACAFSGWRPFSQIIRVITGSRPGAFGWRISPVNRRLRKTAPTGAWSPVFSANWRKPSGVVMCPQASPMPNFEVEIGYVARRAPSAISMSFWSLTLMMTRLGPSARRSAAKAITAIATRASRRNMQRFLLEFRPLSRGNCGRRAVAAKVQARHPLTKRAKRNVKKPDLEHREERHRDPLIVLDRKPKEVGKINRERHFREGEKGFERHVFAGAPRLGFAFDAVLGCARKIGFVIEDRFENCAGIIDGEADAERKERREEQNFFHPGARMKFALRAYIKYGDGNRRGKKNRNIEQHRSQPGGLRAAGGGMEEHAQTGEEKIGEVRGQVCGRFDLDDERKRAAPDGGQQFLAGLDRAFRPAMLLGFETVHVDRQLGRRDNIRQENKFPASELRAIAQVEIFGQSVVLPPARFADARPTPESGGSVEIEKAAAAAASRLLEEQMALEGPRPDAGEQRIAAIKMSPTRLDHADLRIGKEMDRALQEVRVRDEIRVEDADELAFSRGQPSLERARLEARPVGSVDQVDIEPSVLQGRHAGGRQLLGIVGRIVQHLDVEQVFRIIDFANRAQKPLDYIDLIEDRQLHRHHRQLLKVAGRDGRAFPVFQE